MTRPSLPNCKFILRVANDRHSPAPQANAAGKARLAKILGKDGRVTVIGKVGGNARRPKGVVADLGRDLSRSGITVTLPSLPFCLANSGDSAFYSSTFRANASLKARCATIECTVTVIVIVITSPHPENDLLLRSGP